MANLTTPTSPLPSTSTLFHLPTSTTLLTLLLLLLPPYLLLTHHLRHRRTTHHSSLFPTPSSLTHMTQEQASRIHHTLSSLEFPLLYEKALAFALFRTYGIPSISTLLAQTSQLAAPATACKRYVDTAVLVAEWIGHEWGGERWVESLARTNALHRGYVLKGRIGQEDLLYTLSLFAGEPIRWVQEWEWRALSEVERCAVGVFWKGVGEALGIGYGVLPGAEKGWRDGGVWLREVGEWAKEYERVQMVPARSNWLVAEQTVAVLVWRLPAWAKPFAKKVVCVLMDERLRRAMMYEEPPKWLVGVVHALLRTRRWVLRYLALPRPEWMRVRFVSEEKTREGRYHAMKYDALPFYVEGTVWNRFGPGAWLGWLLGIPLPGSQGGKYSPEGYRINEVGPSPSMGREYWEEMKKSVEEVGRRTCPVEVDSKKQA